jgi:DNA-binding IclR family transcriptional regulator
MVATDIDVSDWLHLIRAEYLEIPGLSLTPQQAQRLWGLDPETCDALLHTMVETKFLRRTSHGLYVRTDI